MCWYEAVKLYCCFSCNQLIKIWCRSLLSSLFCISVTPALASCLLGYNSLTVDAKGQRRKLSSKSRTTIFLSYKTQNDTSASSPKCARGSSKELMRPLSMIVIGFYITKIHPTCLQLDPNPLNLQTRGFRSAHYRDRESIEVITKSRERKSAEVYVKS